ncbi:FtsX-like permease family protein [Nocardioides daphniae]|uniref:ABC transporter permease n=1 Tax=Nocardioides daphniae TaxID=402297 RepID=A0A4V1CWI4_9ACTN|nr:ABC transporter permease [Nocardioides daphniae]QCC77377.1 ABC transporter permease [Nocardioides daphniae]GGD24738.1 ABC transporter substrate-binding protein [Nocardioides daphniae]
MFVAWRDLKVAKGRFALIATVVTLITVLVTFLAGLTGGLANQNIAALTSLDVDRIVFATHEGEQPSFADSVVTEAQADAWASQAGVAAVEPLGISTARLSAGDRQEAVTLFGGGPGTGTVDAPQPGQLLLNTTTADALGVAQGQQVEIADRTFVVRTTTDDDLWYSHMPVVYADLDDWRALVTQPGNRTPFATVLGVSGTDVDYAAADIAADTTSMGVLSSLTALKSFKSEIGSLLLMVGMLFGISALVVGAFFTVWSIQRQPDVAVLKALGATNRMLTLDALGQAAVVLLLGVSAGIATTSLLGLAARNVLPFVLNPLTTVVPGFIMTALGLAGAALATRSITTTDPLTALGSNR